MKNLIVTVGLSAFFVFVFIPLFIVFFFLLTKGVMWYMEFLLSVVSWFGLSFKI